MLIFLSFCMSVLFCDLIDSRAHPRRPVYAGGAVAIGFRIAVIAWIWAVAYVIARRPIYAFVATAVTTGIVVVVSDLKQMTLREPLVFSDFALLAEIVAHPRLFYLEAPALLGLGGATVTVVGASLVWWHFEPVSAPYAVVLAVAAYAAILPFLLILSGPRSWLEPLVKLVVPVPRRDGHLPTLGLLASLLVYWIGWLSAGRETDPGPAEADEQRSFAGCEFDAVVVIQAESFVDLRRHGSTTLVLPAYDALKPRALAAGLLEVPCAGAYTLRPEASVITGIGFEGFGFDAFHPYLRIARFARGALPRRFTSRWRSLFIHPHAKAFFQRDRAISALGFAQFIDEAAFSPADRDGPYVGDLAVGARVLDEISAAREAGVPVFVHVVTMEAHDPFGPQRVPGIQGPTAQFVHHLRNADRLLARLAENLDQTADRVLLVHYGDHIPVLADFPDPMSDTRTDFLVVELGRNARRDRPFKAISRPEHLYGMIAAMCGLDGLHR